MPHGKGSTDVTDHPTTQDRPNGATCKHPKRGLERGQECVFFPPFSSDGFGMSGIGLGSRKLSPSRTTR